MKPNSVHEDTVITFTVATEKQPADNWILDTGATNHVTGNHHLFESLNHMAKGEHQVKTANNKIVDAEGSGTISFYVDRPSAKPAKIVLRHVFYVPACGTNNLLSIIQLMRKRVNFEFNLDRAIASLRSVLVYLAPVINSLFILRTSPSTSTLMVVDTLNPYKNAEIYSGIRQKVEKKDILVWHARLGHLSLPAIKRLPNTVKGIQLHARSPSACSCEGCIVGKMFRRPILTSEDKAKTRLLELIHSDVIGPMQTQTMQGYRYIIMFTDDYSRYSEVYLMTLVSQAPVKFKEYDARVENQHSKSKVCRIRVDGGGEYGSREKFLNYLAQEGITREVSALDSQQQNGISERCNRTVLDPARSMCMHAGMPNKLWAEAVATAVYIKNRLPTRALPNSTPYER